MKHRCRVCRHLLADEKFSGKGRTRHICRQCSKLPGEEIRRKEDENARFRLFNQSRISARNIRMLESMCKKYTGKLIEQAEAVFQLARIRPYKKKRPGYIYHNYHELFDRLVKLDLIEDRKTPLVEAEEVAEAHYDAFESDGSGFQEDLEDESWSEGDFSEDEDYDDLLF